MISMRTSSSKVTFAWWLLSASWSTLLTPLHLHEAGAVTYNVVPSAADDDSSSSDATINSHTAGSATAAYYDLSGALALAGPGDIVSLGDGTYDDSIISVTDGEFGNPITVIGGPGAVIKASSPSVRVRHSWITLQARKKSCGCGCGCYKTLS